MSTNRDELLDRAMRYMSSEHNNLVGLRDQVILARTKAIEYGNLAEALHSGEIIANLNGRIEGLSIGTTQLQMIRDDERIES